MHGAEHSKDITGVGGRANKVREAKLDGGRGYAETAPSHDQQTTSSAQRLWEVREFWECMFGIIIAKPR